MLIEPMTMYILHDVIIIVKIERYDTCLRYSRRDLSVVAPPIIAVVVLNAGE